MLGRPPFLPPGRRRQKLKLARAWVEPALYHRTTSYTGGGVGLTRRRSCDTGASLRRWQHTGGVAAVYKGWRDATRQSGSRFYQPHKVSFPPLSTSRLVIPYLKPLLSLHCCSDYNKTAHTMLLFQTLKYSRRFHKTILPLLLDDTKNVVQSFKPRSLL